MRSASRKVGAPTGMIMNSWKSTVLSACLPPLRMFIIGTGRTRGVGAAEVAVQRQAERRRRRRGRRPATRRGWRWRRACALFGVPSSSIISWSMPTWSRASWPSSSAAMASLTFSTALSDALAEVALLVAVAQLDGLVRAGAGAAGDGGPADGAVGEDDVDLDGRVAAAVEDLAGVNAFDGRHRRLSRLGQEARSSLLMGYARRSGFQVERRECDPGKKKERGLRRCETNRPGGNVIWVVAWQGGSGGGIRLSESPTRWRPGRPARGAGGDGSRVEDPSRGGGGRSRASLLRGLGPGRSHPCDDASEW